MFHVGDNLSEFYVHNQPAVPRYFFVPVYFGFLGGEMWFEVGSDLQKFLGFLPLLEVFIAIMLAFALHDPFG